MVIPLLKSLVRASLPLFDLLSFPLTVVAAIHLKLIRRLGVQNMAIARKTFNTIGVFPIRDHYYEPLFNPAHLHQPLARDRTLPGIDWNTSEQLALLDKFDYGDELKQFPLEKTDKSEFYYHNIAYVSGDAEYLYNMIRYFKPSTILEIGSGFSTLMAVNGIRQNQQDNPDYHCNHVCVEPYEMKWLEEIPEVRVERTLVENLNKELFLNLKPNDILFIDSSHVIRPQGDVVFEYLEILPIIPSGVIVHIHDIFSPKDYPREWVVDNVFLWNEQYLLEAFLSNNDSYRILGALNYLTHHYPQEIVRCCPILAQEIDHRQPGAFWMIKN